MDLLESVEKLEKEMEIVKYQYLELVIRHFRLFSLSYTGLVKLMFLKNCSKRIELLEAIVK
jgi:hypothetical protein